MVVLALVSAGLAARYAGPLLKNRPQTPARAKADAARQPRTHSVLVAVDPASILVDDGDTVEIAWSRNDKETVRILGIDSPETEHQKHEIPRDQPYGREARAFAQGAFAAARQVELLRAATLDPYGRTLGYLFINQHNYSVLIIKARLAEETVSHYGDNGFPDEAARVKAAAAAAGRMPFEPPHKFRARMRAQSRESARGKAG